MSQARLDGVEERLTDAGREAGHHPFDDAADAVPTLAGLLDLRDHAVCGLQVRAPDRRALDVRLDLFRRDGIRGDPSNLSSMSEELDALRLQDLARDRAGDHERGGHAAEQLAPSAEFRLASVLPHGGEVAVPRPRDAGVFRICLRLHVLVRDNRYDRLAGRRARSEPFRELDAIFLLPLGGQEALAGPTAVELRLHRPRIDWCAGSEPLDRAANEGAMARPEDRRPVPRAEGVHPTTAWRAPSARMSSRNDGYETWKHHGSERSRGPLAVRPATAAAISIR